jgi:hypothetical protein
MKWQSATDHTASNDGITMYVIEKNVEADDRLLI